ncbi:hypothetical protein BN1708_014503, partial [Verticillium longisporum]
MPSRQSGGSSDQPMLPITLRFAAIRKHHSCLGRRSRFENVPALTRSLMLDAGMLVLARSLSARNDQLASLVFVGYGQHDVERARRGWVSSKQLVQPGRRWYFDRLWLSRKGHLTVSDPLSQWRASPALECSVALSA